jgi:hypothetical protein
MNGWRRNDETAGAADIDASGDFAGGVANVRRRHPKIDVTAACRDRLDACGQRAVLRLEPA